MNEYSTFTLLDPQFFASLEQKAPGPEYREVVGGVLAPEAWAIAARGVWTHVHPREWQSLQQGWKLHVSATPENAPAVLERVARVLRDDPAAFKFASDLVILHVILSKNWPREGGGKFITVYPAGEEQFQRLARALADATAGLDGPYILSDRRVPGSRIVFYRYGEHLPLESVDPRGHRVHHIAAPSGDTAADHRRGYYHLPEWVDDPYGARPVRVLEPAEGAESTVTLNGRYQVRGFIKYSNMGGMYHGWDLEREQPVVIRERRPCTGWINRTTDAVALLHKEARILRLLDGTGWTPGYVDSFQAWEHHYLVMEQVQGLPLRDYAVSRYFRPRKIASPRRLFWTLRHLILELLRGIEEFHRRGIVIRDLSVYNVLVRPDRSLCFLDFEYAWERDGEQAYAPRIETPGFASPGQAAGRPPTEADDFYSLGAVVVELCSMLAPGLALNRGGILDAAELELDEIGLPHELIAVARGLLEPDPRARWDAAAVRRALGEVRSSAIPWRAREPGKGAAPEALVGDGAEAEVAAACEAVCRFFEASADPARQDCLWPGSPETYRINPVCVRFGACGPLEYVRRVRGSCPDAWLDWVEQRAVPERCPPGLYVGLAGVALTLAACGREDTARRLLLDAVKTPLPPTLGSLYDGAAGVGLAALALGSALDDAALKDEAVRIGGELEGRGERRRRGIAWRAGDGSIPCGLGDGGSGIALFYTYLGACTGEARYWEVAKQALDYEFSQASWGSGYAFWPLAAESRRRKYRSPHVFFGSAGVGTAAARLYACTGDPELREWAERCAHTLTFRFTNKLWQDMGLAGWGETLLDMRAATGGAAHRGHALRVAEALLPTRVETRFGTAFPGGGLHRVASDFGMGASGIALFLHRLVHGGHRAFFPDHLLPGWPAVAPAGDPAAASAALPPLKIFAGEPGAAGADEALSEERAPGTSGAGAAPRPAGRARAKGRARTPA